MFYSHSQIELLSLFQSTSFSFSKWFLQKAGNMTEILPKWRRPLNNQVISTDTVQIKNDLKTFANAAHYF